MGKVAASWAGGKDSSLVYYRAMRAGYEVPYLLNFITQDAKASMTHGLRSELLRAQAKAIGIANKNITMGLCEALTRSFKD